MVQIIAGEKGKGKTKILLDMVNSDILQARGTICYLDKSNQHMFELNNKVRLINVNEYGIESADEFVGFISGIISQDNDLEKIYLDSFLKLANLSAEDADKTIEKIDQISSKFGVEVIVSFSQNSDKLSETVKSKVKVAL